MAFTFDFEKAAQNATPTPANPANPANPAPKQAKISNFSKISSPPPPNSGALPEAELNELKRLVNVVGRHWGFTDQEMIEAMQSALADQERALTCFRTLAGELPPEDLPPPASGHRHVPVTTNTASGRYSFYIDTTADLPNALFLPENERAH